MAGNGSKLRILEQCTCASKREGSILLEPSCCSKRQGGWKSTCTGTGYQVFWDYACAPELRQTGMDSTTHGITWKPVFTVPRGSGPPGKGRPALERPCSTW